MYEQVTEGIRVLVTPQFLPDESAPEESRFMWAYTIEINNLSHRTVQLINRYWRIVDGRGGVQEVRGEGVVGKQPTLMPGEGFAYTSGCPLTTPSGMMGGHYEMVDVSSGEDFIAVVPTFALESPQSQTRAN